MMTLQSIAHALGGQVSGREVHCPTPGHNKRDRGTAIRLAEGAPDGLLIACYNGGWHEVAQVKDTLRNAGLLPAYDGTRRELTDAERAAIKRAEAEREREKAEAQANAAEFVRQRLTESRPADPMHPYLVRKRIAPERLWQRGDLLLAPIADETGRLWNWQTIAADGTKRFAKGGRLKGLFWWAGKADAHLVIGEGVATVAAIRRATGLPVVAALSAHNLPVVAALIRTRRPELALTIAADDDPTGIDAARRAAAETGAALALPEIAA